MNVRVNEQIDAKVVRLIDADKRMYPAVTIENALQMARAAGLDLVEVNPKADPPVCKILDYGHMKLQQEENRVFRPGNYRHFKGGMYTALSLVTHHATRQPMVVYVSHEKGEPNVRPLKPMPGDESAWDDWVEHEDERVRRFEYVGPSKGGA